MQINDESIEEDDSDDDEYGVEDEEEDDDDDEMDTAEVAVHKGKQANGKIVAKKAKDEPMKAKKKSKGDVGNGKTSKTDSKASDDYDFNTDYTDDKVNGEAEDDDEDDDEEDEDDDDDDEESMED